MHLIDASVWVAIADPADRFHATAHAMVAKVEMPLAALDLTLYEVANVMGPKKGQAREGRFLVKLIEKRCRESLVAVDSDLLESALEVAAEHGLTAYDAAYVAAARRHGWTLVSADVADLVSKGLAVAPDGADYP
ncbi:MAG TPA: PIN domain-containing protein [Solirubrobacterales bacterium]|nr:PIN domain-containing protein [Solirubrobacterales bacterium]